MGRKMTFGAKPVEEKRSPAVTVSMREITAKRINRSGLACLVGWRELNNGDNSRLRLFSNYLKTVQGSPNGDVTPSSRGSGGWCLQYKSSPGRWVGKQHKYSEIVS